MALGLDFDAGNPLLGPSNGPYNEFRSHQNHYMPRHINNRNINSYSILELGK